MIYYFIFSILCVLGLWDTCINRIKSQRLFFVVAIFMTLFAGTRLNIGIDYGTYLNEYNNINAGNSSMTEVTFYILSKLLPTINYVILFYAIITVPLQLYMIKKYVYFSYAGILLFYSFTFINFDMGIMRQGAALAFSLFSIQFIYNRNLKRFLVCIIIASLFHLSAIVFLPTFWFAKKNYSKYLLFFVPCIALVLGMMNWVQVLAKLLYYIPIEQIQKYYRLLININYTSSGFALTDLRRIVLLLCFIIVIKRYSDTIFNNILVNIYAMGTTIGYLFFSSTSIYARGSFYFCIVEILLFPILIERFKNKGIKFLLYTLLCLYSFYYLTNMINSDVTSWMNAPYIPYKTFLF